MAAAPAATKPPKRRHVGPYELTRVLGQGSFGKVRLGVQIFTGEKVAIKTIKYKNVKSDIEKKHIEREKAILSLLRHPNIVRLEKVVEDKERDCCYLILEYVPGGELFDYIVSHGRIKEKDARKFVRQMISALEYCHAHLIVHRDLKPENLLLDEDLNIKITDFGLSNIIEPGQKFSTFCGSLHYACPEILRGEAYVGPGVDIWAMGVILYCMVVGSQPWDGRSSEEMIDKIFNEGIVIPDWISEECANLIVSMLRVREKDRIKIEEMKRHPWVVQDYNGPPDSYLPDHTPVPEIDEEIMGMLVQIGFDDTPEARAEILANKKTQLVATYHLLRQRVEAKRLESAAPPKKKKEKKDKDKKKKKSKDSNESVKGRKRSHSIAVGEQPSLSDLTSSSRKPSDEAKSIEQPKHAGSARAPAISIYTVDKATGTTKVDRSSSPARSSPNSPLRASVDASLYASPPRSRPSATKKVSMPKLRLDSVRKSDEDRHVSPARLVTIREDSELHDEFSSWPNSPASDRPAANDSSESEDEGSDEPEEEETVRTRPRSPSVAVTDAERASITRPRSPSGSIPKRPVLNLEDLKKHPPTKRKKQVGAIISPRHAPVRKSIRDVFDIHDDPEESPRDSDDPSSPIGTPTANSGMFGYSTTSSLPSNEIRERVARVLTECGVAFKKDKSNIFHCSNNETRLQIEIVKIAKFKNLKGVKLSRVSGDVWAYKAVADKILSALKL